MSLEQCVFVKDVEAGDLIYTWEDKELYASRILMIISISKLNNVELKVNFLNVANNSVFSHRYDSNGSTLLFLWNDENCLHVCPRLNKVKRR